MGETTWTCGLHGDWLGFPDQSQCTKINVNDTLNDLDDEESVPSDVLNNFIDSELNENDNLASGDVSQVVQVFEKAIEVQ